MFVLATACTRSVPATTAPPGGASERLEIASTGHLLVPARIDGRPYMMVLDTGANITSLSTRVARDLAITSTGSIAINNTIRVPTGTIRELAISGIAHRDLPIAIVDLPEAPQGVAGILGLDVLARHDIVVDFPERELTVYPAGTLVSSRGDLVPLEYGANGLILLDVSLDGRKGIPAMLDLGAPVSVLNRPAGVLVGARGPLVHIAARTGDARLEPVRALVRDLGTFHRLGLARRPALVLGSDTFADRVLAISYRDRVARVLE